MFASTRRSTNPYAAVALETGVAGADPHQLVLMLYDGALATLKDARRHMTQGENAAKGKAITKALEIIGTGLRGSLNADAGPLAERYAALYDYMGKRLVLANASNDPSIIDEVTRLLGELREAWEAIRPKVVAPRRPAPRMTLAPGAYMAA